MWRHRATCSHCGLKSRWNRDRELSEAEILAHLKDSHNCEIPQTPDDYLVERERQCDSCLEPYVDDCTKCGAGFLQPARRGHRRPLRRVHLKPPGLRASSPGPWFGDPTQNQLLL